MHFQVWSVLALIALVFVFSSTAKSAVNPDIDKVDEVNGITGLFEKSGHSIQKRDDESEESDEEPEEPTTPKPKKKKKITPNPGGVVIVNEIVNKVPKGGRYGKQNQEHYNEQPAPAPVAAQPAEQEGKGIWPFLKNVAQIVHMGVGVAGLFVG